MPGRKHAPSRRTAFRTGCAAILLLLAAGGVGTWLAAGYDVAPGTATSATDAREAAVARALAETLRPGEAEVAEHALAAAAEDEALRRSLLVVEYAPLLLGYGTRFTRLSPEDRARAFAEMRAHAADRIAAAAREWERELGAS